MSSEVERLVELGDVDAILDQLHQYSTEWDDARGALDRLVGKAAGERDEARAEVEQLRTTLGDWERKAAALTEQRNTAMSERDKALAEVERLRGELEQRCDREDCEQYREWLSWEKAKVSEQLDSADGRVLRALTAVDERGDLHALTADELTRIVMTAIRDGDDPEPGA